MEGSGSQPVMVCVGAAVQDVFLRGAIFTPHYEAGDWEEEFKVGDKYEVDEVIFSTGGGATNAATTFVRQGLKAIFLGKVGNDPAGTAVLAALKDEGIDISRVKQVSDVGTSYSTILLAPDGSRTVLNYRGASRAFGDDEFSLDEVEADWLYLSSLAGNMSLLEKLVGEAKAKQMRVAINPGKRELENADWLKQILHSVDVLTLNKEELGKLVEGDSAVALVRHASDMSPIVVMTDGPRGVVATDRQVVIKAGMYEDIPVVDRTGAGDAFGSGLVAKLAYGVSLKEAIIFASANSTSVVGQIGAKAGILRADAQLHGMPIEEMPF